MFSFTLKKTNLFIPNIYRPINRISYLQCDKSSTCYSTWRDTTRLQLASMAAKALATGASVRWRSEKALTVKIAAALSGGVALALATRVHVCASSHTIPCTISFCIYDVQAYCSFCFSHHPPCFHAFCKTTLITRVTQTKIWSQITIVIRQINVDLHVIYIFSKIHQ